LHLWRSPEHRVEICGLFGIRNKDCAMTLKSALEDLKQNTLSKLSGLLARLAYLASLRRGSGHYEHWGMTSVYGPEAAEGALRTAHQETVAAVLKTPLVALEQDLEVSRAANAVSARAYVKDMVDHLDDLVPAGGQGGPCAAHLSSVLAALSSLKQYPTRSTRSAS
jgi:hypothetical protein